MLLSPKHQYCPQGFPFANIQVSCTDSLFYNVIFHTFSYHYPRVHLAPAQGLSQIKEFNHHLHTNHNIPILFSFQFQISKLPFFLITFSGFSYGVPSLWFPSTHSLICSDWIHLTNCACLPSLPFESSSLSCSIISSVHFSNSIIILQDQYSIAFFFSGTLSFPQSLGNQLFLFHFFSFLFHCQKFII